MLVDMQGKLYCIGATSLWDLDYRLRVMISSMAASAKADIAVMAARAKGQNPRYWRGLSLA